MNAQITIGSTSVPNANAMLELREQGTITTKGLLLPRVELVAPTNPSPLAVHIEGMVVYNTTTNATLLPGLYQNNGIKWIPAEIPEGSSQGQFLVIDKETLTPKWITKIIPVVRNGEYKLIEVGAFTQDIGPVISSNSGSGKYDENLTKTATSSWKSIIAPFTIKVNTSENRLVLFIQTSIIQNQYGVAGWTSYAGGIFIDNLLKGVRVGTLNATGNDAELSKAETLFFVIQGLQPGTHTIDIAFIRRNSSPNEADNSPLYIGKSFNTNSPGAASLSYQYYEK